MIELFDVWQGSEFASDHDTVIFSNHTSLENLFFLESYKKKEDTYESWIHNRVIPSKNPGNAK